MGRHAPTGHSRVWALGYAEFTQTIYTITTLRSIDSDPALIAEVVPHASTLDRRVIVRAEQGKRHYTGNRRPWDWPTTATKKNDPWRCGLHHNNKNDTGVQFFSPWIVQALIRHVRVRLDLHESAICKTQTMRTAPYCNTNNSKNDTNPVPYIEQVGPFVHTE